MSGKLVGEVLDAAEAGHLDGLSDRGFHALIAIAEKCHAQTRQGSVRWDRIRAGLCGASLRTAKRAVEDLQKFGAIRLVKRGFNNHAGRACAPLYEIQPLGQRVTQVTQSVTGPTGHVEKPTGQIGEPTGHPGVLLDGSIDGSIDGSTDGVRASATPKAPPSTSSHKQQPDPYCPNHMPHGTVASCGACGAAARIFKAWKNQQAENKQLEAATRRRTIKECKRCRGEGWLDLADNVRDRCECNPRARKVPA